MDTKNPKPEWISVKSKYQFGQIIQGKVIMHMPFGVFVDIGEEEVLGFIRVVNLTDKEAQDPYTSDYPEIGKEVNAVIVDFTDHNQQICLSLKASDFPSPLGPTD